MVFLQVRPPDWPLAVSLQLMNLEASEAAVPLASTRCQRCNPAAFLSADSPVLTSRVAVTVHVLDINEFPPELASPYETFVCENARLGQVRPPDLLR